MISRRLFLALTGTAFVLPPAWASEQPPQILDRIMLDHIILGCNDLDAGVAFVEDHTGVRAVVGGVHPGRGTANALLSLGASPGECHYLEIMAPDPKATSVQPSAVPQVRMLKALTTPRLITWAAHPPDIDALAKKLRGSGIAIMGATPGSRKRPDGRVLNWKSLGLADDHQGLLPFFIEWSADSVHPSADSPQGCHIERFVIADRDPEKLSQIFRLIGIDLSVERRDKPELRARITGPKGSLDVNS
jgi:catechol 2,3-dioxygenase-like lactoylglutathione lyase family enzyme